MEQQSNHEVFVSFSFKDQLLTEKIINQLLNVYGISCWICTQDIRAGENYKRTIVQAITSSKLILLIQSESSMQSQEVPKEISIALNRNKPVIPFVIDGSELSDDLEYDLLDVQRIDATKPTLEDRIEDLARQICSTIGRPFTKNGAECQYVDSKSQRLISTASVIPKKVFCGREDVLSEIESTFDSGERVVFLCGIGGIGKTQIAKQYAKRFKDKYDTIVYATYNESLKDMIISDTVFAINPPLIRYTMDDGAQESNDSYFQRKLELIKQISDERTLIIIDNFDVEEDEFLPSVADGKYHLLITTRCDYSRYYSTIKINALTSVEHLKSIFMQNYCGDEVMESDPLLVDLIELVNRHTYTIELLALHMENSGQSVAEMIEAIKKEGILSLSEQVRNSDMKTQVAYENLLKMFKIFSLNDEERQVLMYLSLMPVSGINTRDFKEWAQLSTFKTIRSLENRSWIIRNTDGIALHPIIRDVVKHEIPVNIKNGKDFLDNFTKTICDKNAWSFKKSEKDRYSTITKSVLEQFTEITPETEEFYYHAESLISFNFEAEYALELAKRIYDYHLKTSGEVSFKTAQAALKVGWVYANTTQLPDTLNNACRWLELSERFFSQVNLETAQEISRRVLTNTNLAEMHLKLYQQTKDPRELEKGLARAQFALEKSIASFTPGEYHYGKIGASNIRLCMLRLEMKEYDKALEHIETALDIFTDLFGESDADSMISFWLKASALYGLERYSEAKVLAQKSAVGLSEYMGYYHYYTYQIYMLLGDCNAKLNEVGQAVEAYKEALKIAEAIYRPNSTPIKEAAERIELYAGVSE